MLFIPMLVFTLSNGNIYPEFAALLTEHAVIATVTQKKECKNTNLM